MPKPEKNAMALVDACRSPIRRKIMILAEEAALTGKVVTAKSVSEQLDGELSSVSYHINQLLSAGALQVVGGEQQRGAWQRHLLPTEAFKAQMTDTVVLDRIAELMDGSLFESSGPTADELIALIRASGRPVEA
jgi:DNA-binding transcriptional ArsR family regulator